MISLLYVSRPLLDGTNRPKALDDIQAVATARNSTLNITGLLICSDDYFVQLLEGPAANVDAVMAGILADPRHHDVRILRRAEVVTRSVPLWRMARFDGENFKSLAIAPIAAAAHALNDPQAIRRLDRLIQDLSRTGELLKV